MKKIITLLLICAALCGCSAKTAESKPADSGNISSDSKTDGTVSSADTQKPVQSGSSASTEESKTSTVSSSELVDWEETAFEAVMYVNESCYSRVEAIIGADTADFYEQGTKVNVVAKTDTEYYKLSDGNYIHFDFLSDKDNTLEEISNTSDESSDTSYIYIYMPPELTDDRIEVKNGITYIDGILIANKTYSLPSDYDPGTDNEAYEALSEMEADAALEGIAIWLNSGYRSYELQKSIYENYCYSDGQEEADTYSARPGHSEHQTGLAFDLNSFEESFGDTPEGIWLAKNCYKYGFIIRYPKGKEPITGYIYEPWHVRYLGRELAEKVYKSGVCLEEYLGITSKYAD